MFAKPGSGSRFCDSRALAPKSFNNTTEASDRESQIASLTPVSPVSIFSVQPQDKDGHRSEVCELSRLKPADDVIRQVKRKEEDREQRSDG